MNTNDSSECETDPRFPSGPWTGFYLQPAIPGRHRMELHLSFRNGSMTGEGRDPVGNFIFRGRYDVQDGRCYWTKRYLGKHDVFYQGFNEGKGIWGTWEIPAMLIFGPQRGGFHIWPQGMEQSTGAVLHEEADLPQAVSEPTEVAEPVGTPS